MTDQYARAWFMGFMQSPAVARVLREAARKVAAGETSRPIFVVPRNAAAAVALDRVDQFDESSFRANFLIVDLPYVPELLGKELSPSAAAGAIVDLSIALERAIEHRKLVP